MKLPQISTQWIDQADGQCKLQVAGYRSLKCGKSWIAFVFCCFTLMRHRKKKSGSWDFRKCIGNNLTLRTKFMFHCCAFFCYNYTLFSTDGNVSIQLDKIKSHKRPVHLLTLTFNFSLRILQSYDSKTFSLLFLKYMAFLTRSIIYATRTQLLTYLLQIIQIHFQKSQLPFFFLLRCRVSVKQQNKKAIQLLPHLSEILNCNLQFTCTIHRVDPFMFLLSWLYLFYATQVSSKKHINIDKRAFLSFYFFCFGGLSFHNYKN